jgi:D-alanyl-D-alanine endopeptidase (penicillin-binding protein 7)
MAGAAACEYPLIQAVTITCPLSVKPYNGRGELRFGNTNRLLRSAACEIQLSKTCYTNEAGCCITMQAEIAAPPPLLSCSTPSAN